MELIAQQNGKSFFDYCEKSGNTICGRHPIGVLLGALAANKNLATETKFVNYSQSEKVMSAQQCSVSYAASVTMGSAKQ